MGSMPLQEEPRLAAPAGANGGRAPGAPVADGLAEKSPLLPQRVRPDFSSAIAPRGQEKGWKAEISCPVQRAGPPPTSSVRVLFCSQADRLGLLAHSGGGAVRLVPPTVLLRCYAYLGRGPVLLGIGGRLSVADEYPPQVSRCARRVGR